jgi:hypothetical protein
MRRDSRDHDPTAVLGVSQARTRSGPGQSQPGQARPARAVPGQARPKFQARNGGDEEQTIRTAVLEPWARARPGYTDTDSQRRSDPRCQARAQGSGSGPEAIVSSDDPDSRLK